MDCFILKKCSVFICTWIFENKMVESSTSVSIHWYYNLVINIFVPLKPAYDIIGFLI